ncbi:LysR family transcriptional regulator [Pseudochelatococcus lubricantis]|uniref:LysR family transcriptional regulator n=1 Tax=Pseudochelatococcus lubricantis TaxID=1538102 RepID=UPI0035E708EC
MNRIDIAPFEFQLFLEVAASRNFSRAAEMCGLSQPAVSRAIVRLEQRLNVRLFDRTSRQIVLTPHGEAFLPIARRVIHDLTVSLDELRSYVSSVVGHVSIAALPSLAFSFLPDVISGFHKDFPAVTIEILDTFKQNVASAVAKGEVDFGISAELDETEPHLEYRHLKTDRFRAVVQLGHPLAKRKSITWDELLNHPFIAMRERTSVRSLTDRVFQNINPEKRPVLETSHPSTAGAMIAAGLGVTALPDLTLPLVAHRQLKIIDLQGPILERRISIISRRNRTLPHLAGMLYNRFLKSDDT